MGSVVRYQREVRREIPNFKTIREAANRKLRERRQETPSFMTIHEAANYLRTSYRTIRRAVDEGRLPCAQLGEQTYRISRDVLDRFISGGGKIEEYGKGVK